LSAPKLRPVEVVVERAKGARYQGVFDIIILLITFQKPRPPEEVRAVGN
jgi:hypothetical protein